MNNRMTQEERALILARYSRTIYMTIYMWYTENMTTGSQIDVSTINDSLIVALNRGEITQEEYEWFKNEME